MCEPDTLRKGVSREEKRISGQQKLHEQRPRSPQCGVYVIRSGLAWPPAQSRYVGPHVQTKIGDACWSQAGKDVSHACGDALTFFYSEGELSEVVHQESSTIRSVI